MGIAHEYNTGLSPPSPHLLLPVFPISVNGNCISSCSVQKHWHHPPSPHVCRQPLSSSPEMHPASDRFSAALVQTSHHRPLQQSLIESLVSIPGLPKPGINKLFLKSRRVNISGSVSQMVSAATTQLGCRGLKAASHTTQTTEHGSVPINWRIRTEPTLQACMPQIDFQVILLLSQPSSNVKNILICWLPRNRQQLMAPGAKQY